MEVKSPEREESNSEKMLSISEMFSLRFKSAGSKIVPQFSCTIAGCFE